MHNYPIPPEIDSLARKLAETLAINSKTFFHSPHPRSELQNRLLCEAVSGYIKFPQSAAHKIFCTLDCVPDAGNQTAHYITAHYLRVNDINHFPDIKDQINRLMPRLTKDLKLRNVSRDYPIQGIRDANVEALLCFTIEQELIRQLPQTTTAFWCRFVQTSLHCEDYIIVERLPIEIFPEVSLGDTDEEAEMMIPIVHKKSSPQATAPHGAVAPPAARHPVVAPPLEEEWKCSICWRELSALKALTPAVKQATTQCGHLFCNNCIQTIDSCAVCRAPIVARIIIHS